jgi:hypothetical protein
VVVQLLAAVQGMREAVVQGKGCQQQGLLLLLLVVPAGGQVASM